MKFLARGMFTALFLALIVLLLGILILVTIRSDRSSTLYRMKIGVLGLLIGLWGCSTSTLRGDGEGDTGDEDYDWVSCYAAPIDWIDQEDPDFEEVEAETIEEMAEIEAEAEPDLPEETQSDIVEDGDELDGVTDTEDEELDAVDEDGSDVEQEDVTEEDVTSEEI
ncbi:MAG: hypothetical protein ABIJ56_21740 [Pseudomonadota bacterium]